MGNIKQNTIWSLLSLQVLLALLPKMVLPPHGLLLDRPPPTPVPIQLMAIKSPPPWSGLLFPDPTLPLLLEALVRLPLTVPLPLVLALALRLFSLMVPLPSPPPPPLRVTTVSAISCSGLTPPELPLFTRPPLAPMTGVRPTTSMRPNGVPTVAPSKEME